MTLVQDRPLQRRRVAIDTEPKFITIWGPIGSTGKSTLAVNLAYELSQLGKRVLLLDLDTHAPALATLLPINKGTAGLAGAARLIRQGRFTPEELDRLSLTIKYRGNKLKLLQGLASPTRWPEITPETITQLLGVAKFNHDVIIADLASPLEDKLLGAEHPTNRNAATRTALALSTVVISIIHGTQLSVSRYLNLFNQLDELQKTRKIIFNRSDPNPKLAAAIKTLTRETIFGYIPNDEPAIQLAEAQNLPLALARRKAPARAAILSLANKLLE